MANETLKSITIKGVTFDVPSGGGGGGAVYRLGKYANQIRLTEDGVVVSTVTDSDTTYTAGQNVNISSSNVISATDTTYTAGTNVSISSGNVISARDTTYSAGSGLSLTGTTFSAKTGYTTSGNNRAVQADANGNLYVEQKDDDTTYAAGSNVQISSSNVISATDTTYSAGSGLSLSGTTMNHSNSVTAQTTESLSKVKYDAQGHITGSSAVVKKDITDLGVPAQDTTYTAGSGINIDSNNVISATGGGGGGASYRLTKSGSDIKLTEDGTVVSTVTDSDTTYSAGSGLSLSGTTFNHSNSVTARTTATLRKVQYDAQGHITGSSAVVKKDITDLGIPAHRVGDVIITSTNTNPSTDFGGTWELIDKEFTPFVQSYSTTDGVVFNSSYVSSSAERTCLVQRSGHSLRVRGRWKSARVLTDTNVDVWKIPQGLLGISTLTYSAEDIAASDGDNLLAYVSYSWKSNTLTMTSNDVAVFTKYDTPQVGNLWISDYTIPIQVADMLDSACGKFYWKKTA